METTFGVFGVPVKVEFSTVLMLLFFAYSAYGYIKKHYAGQPKSSYYMAAGIVSVAGILSIVAHEFSHGITGTLFGDHIIGAGTSWWGAYVRTQTNPSDMQWFAEFSLAFAGPAMNFFLAGLATLYVWWQGESLTENTVQYFAWLNVSLAKFNMLPLIMLDGSKMLDGLVHIFSSSSDLRDIIIYAVTAELIIYYFVFRKYALAKLKLIPWKWFQRLYSYPTWEEALSVL